MDMKDFAKEMMTLECGTINGLSISQGIIMKSYDGFNSDTCVRIISEIEKRKEEIRERIKNISNHKKKFLGKKLPRHSSNRKKI